MLKTGPKKYIGMFRVYQPGEQSKRGLSHQVSVGAKFGKLTVLGLPFVAQTWKSQQHLFVVCECECGKVLAIPANYLTNGKQTGCGCMKGRHPNARQWKHGDRDKPLYVVWNGMRQRCNNPNQRHYKNYGGRGIKVCPAWNDYTIFRDWANATGYQKGLSLDRINHNAGYGPDNCQWITREENGRKVWTDMAADAAAKDAKIADLRRQLAALTLTPENV